MQTIKITKVVILLIGLTLVSYISSCRKEQQVILSPHNNQYTAQLFWNGNLLFGYKTILKIKDNYNNLIFKKSLYQYYDAYGDWKTYLKEMKWKSNNQLHIEFHESLFAFDKKLLLLNKEKNQLEIDGVTINFKYPSQLSITNYENKF